jgi:hypothetical protein
MTPAAARSPWLERGLIIVAAVLLALAGLLVWLLVIRPAHKANEQAIVHYLQTVREGKAPAPAASCADTHAALRAIAASTGQSVERSTSELGSDADTTACYQIALQGPQGRTTIAVRMWGHASAPLITNVGLAPPCACKRGGAIAGCGP